MKKIFICILLTFFCLCSGCSLYHNQEKLALYKYDYAYEDQLTIASGYAAVEGTVKNLTDKNMESVYLEFYIYDKDQKRIGEAKVVIRNIKPGEAVGYIARSLVPVDKSDTIKLERIGGSDLTNKNQVKRIVDANNKLIPYSKSEDKK